jgi:hypothetical protein
MLYGKSQNNRHFNNCMIYVSSPKRLKSYENFLFMKMGKTQLFPCKLTSKAENGCILNTVLSVPVSIVNVGNKTEYLEEGNLSYEDTQKAQREGTK